MKTLIISIKIFFFFSLLTGIVYPIFITGIAQTLFPHKANGSIILKDGKKIGSELIAQKSDTLIYFESRPSAVNYNPLPSGASNYGLTSTRLKNMVNYRRNKFITFNQLDSSSEVPPEMIFGSGSGLDPHISVKSALMQVDRIAKARNFNAFQREKLVRSIHQHTEGPQYLIFGDERVNVFLLNLDIDRIK